MVIQTLADSIDPCSVDHAMNCYFHNLELIPHATSKGLTNQITRTAKCVWVKNTKPEDIDSGFFTTSKNSAFQYSVPI